MKEDVFINLCMDDLEEKMKNDKTYAYQLQICKCGVMAQNVNVS